MTGPSLQLDQDIEWRVGRNLLVFQRIELNLKLYLAQSQVSGSLDDFPAKARMQAEDAMKQTLGQATHQLIQREVEGDSNASLPENNFRFSTRCTYSDTEARQQAHEAFDRIVKMRNELIHEFLVKFPLAQRDADMEVTAYLDAQYKSACAVLSDTRVRLQEFYELRRSFAEYLASPELARIIAADGAPGE
ncbi:hypothetical protein LAG73_10450 [Pseudoxanthomonas japonensis]|nr:hypothetical protein LAG73_10450 [Pseudoxanthomonas japonensis]